MEINFEPIAKKLQEIIKRILKEKGLVETGKLYNSIECVSDSTGAIKVIAEDYFKYLDEKHGIMDEAFESPDFKVFSEAYLANEFERILLNKV